MNHELLAIKKQMILIADSGSTKTDWCLVEGMEVVKSVATQGITPIHQSPDEIENILKSELLPNVSDYNIDQLFFYGSGCRQDLIPDLHALISRIVPCKHIEIHNDLLAAARALLGTNSGIACILGTGANSCLYDGREIIANTPPLGFILGDEGSGAVIGRNFVNALFKHQLPAELKDEFCRTMHLDLATIINKVYRQPMANRFLASLVYFILEHLECEGVREFVIGNLREFIRKNINPYHSPSMPLNAVGSVAHFFQSEFATAAHAEGYTIGTIMRRPMEGLIKFHQDSNIV